MRVLFQTIGVLVQYNWALPYYIANEKQGLKLTLLTNIYSYLMGGFYYHLKQPKRIVPIFMGSGILRGIDEKLESAFSLSKLYRNSVDVIHLNRPHSQSTRIFLRARAPKIFVFHGSLDPPHVRNLSNVCRELKEINNKVNAFIAVSNHAAKTIEEFCGFKPTVVHNGIDISVFNPFSITRGEARRRIALPTDKKVLLWCGRIDPAKGLHVLVKALPRIIKEFGEKVLLVVKGRTVNKQYLKYLDSVVSKLRISNNVVYRLTWTPNIAMLYYYRSADVYVHTSISEGFSLSLLEAMASGTPVVGNNASSIPEAIGDAGLLYNGSEEDLAQKVLEVLGDESKAVKIGLRAFKRVVERGFTAKAAAEKYIRIYEGL